MASFPTYLAGLQTGFNRVTVFIALKNNPLLKLVFQKRYTLREKFYIGHSRFALYQHLPHIDVCRYVVSRGGLQYRISFLGIDKEVESDTESECRLSTLCMEALRGDVHVSEARDYLPLRPGRFRPEAVVFATVRLTKCRVVLRIGLSHLHGFGSSAGPPSHRLPGAG